MKQSPEEEFLSELIAAGVKPVVEGDRVFLYNPEFFTKEMLMKMPMLNQEKFCEAVKKWE